MSVNHDGSQARGESLVYASSADGSSVVVSSYAHSMVPASYNGRDHVYLLKAPVG
ncbi:hypothetical protein [Aeromicrobium sp. UC242_57]|uniref:hypothetical protein n=1 Tax=Aeromicrobium sp. UC242_57 TaxID=3374624 RepID=UPI0037A099AE